ncbi:hypothetical protein, partial [Bacillus altitudinis]|uniref:hypothetical protein n=1 Tax=Bacillus altitudinis TaxID=293387 RepID=UPI0024ACF8C3
MFIPHRIVLLPLLYKKACRLCLQAEALFKGLFLLTASIIVGCTFIKIKNGGKMKVSVFH